MADHDHDDDDDDDEEEEEERRNRVWRKSCFIAPVFGHQVRD